MEDTLAVRLGEELRSRRRAAGLTQSDLAGRIPHYEAESTRTIISKCERGRVVPSEPMLKAFDRELGAGGGAVFASRAAFDVPDGHLTSTIVSALGDVWHDLRPWASDPDVRALGSLLHTFRAFPRSQP